MFDDGALRKFCESIAKAYGEAKYERPIDPEIKRKKNAAKRLRKARNG